ncbi:hypothetical protein N7495_003603 [Penicillium taxi]|uniref:uncharacterized protein n=1 Tax=Penicillium taxi TaxID=168475 RepID=UPI0025452ADE|nr:uncharacterized protein N7495_003603 [Penicillium taxi]KAJ5898859.1 hypothetical protein N7495_003603 [Penicillium taxi]
MLERDFLKRVLCGSDNLVSTTKAETNILDRMHRLTGSSSRKHLSVDEQSRNDASLKSSVK